MHPRRLLAVTALVVTGGLLLFGPRESLAGRDPVAACQKAIGKAGVALVQATILAEQACLDLLARGRLPQGTQCVGHGPSVVRISDTKTRGKILQAASKARIASERRCASVDFLAPPPDGLGFPAECPAFETACDFLVTGPGSALDCLQCTHVSAAHYLLGVQYPGKVGETAASTATPTSAPTPTPGAELEFLGVFKEVEENFAPTADILPNVNDHPEDTGRIISLSNTTVIANDLNGDGDVDGGFLGMQNNLQSDSINVEGIQVEIVIPGAVVNPVVTDFVPMAVTLGPAGTGTDLSFAQTFFVQSDVLAFLNQNPSLLPATPYTMNVVMRLTGTAAVFTVTSNEFTYSVIVEP